MIEILGAGILCALILMSIISILNALTFPRLKESTPATIPLVSLLVPARNEAEVIGATVQCLLQQKYPAFELIVLNDESTDGTENIARNSAGNDTRFFIESGTAPPKGWTGKNWACHQLAEKAQGEILIFTDADVMWHPLALSSVVSSMERTHADAFSVWPTQVTYSWAERLVVPLMNFAICAYLPELFVRRLPWVSLAAANGQCLAFHRPAYHQIGGHEAVRAAIIEDVALARATKHSRLRLVMSLGEDRISGRMYTNWKEVRGGFAKNILAGHGGSSIALILSTLFHWLVFIFPILWLIFGFWTALNPYWPWVPLVMTALGISVRALSAATSRQRVKDALFMPISVFLMTLIAAQALWWQYRHGGPEWKGRTIIHAD